MPLKSNWLPERGDSLSESAHETIHMYYTLFFLLVNTCFAVWCAKLLQSCLALCNPIDCSPPGSSVRGILQARILEWVAILFFRASSWPRDGTRVSCIAGEFFTCWATREAPLVSLLLSLWEFFFCKVEEPGSCHWASGLVARIWCSHRYDPIPISGGELKPCFKALQDEATWDHRDPLLGFD